MTATDPFDLERFVQAQKAVYESAREELRRGCKTGHWMWFIFPQLRGLGHSAMALEYGIASLAEARAYLDHPVLGPRLRECTGMVQAVEGRTAEEILGGIDALKLRSCLTLFAQAAPEESLFADTLSKYYGGNPDPLTLRRLSAQGI